MDENVAWCWWTKLWCVRCKWKSSPCVLHSNLTSFHCGPNLCQPAHACNIQCAVTLCDVRLVFLWIFVHFFFFLRNNDKSLPSTFVLELKWNKGKTNDKIHSHFAKEGYGFYFYFFFVISFFSSHTMMFMLVVMYYLKMKVKCQRRKKKSNTPSNDREIH